MDLEHYDEFGNYIGPELPDSDSEESVGEEPSEMPLVPTGVVEEGTEEIEEDESMQGINKLRTSNIFYNRFSGFT